MLGRTVGVFLAAVTATASVLVGAAPPPADPIPIDIMTFNIRTAMGRDGDNVWANRRALVAETIARYRPHVIGLQEALDEQIEYLDEALPEYRWLGIDRGLNGGIGLSEYTPIFYRYADLSPIESGNFWLSNTPNEPGRRRRPSRIVTWARFYHRATDREVYVFNTHLTLRRGRRQVESAEQIASRVASLPPQVPVVVTGDFNATAEADETWHAVTSGDLRDAWLAAEEHRGPPLTWSGFAPPASGREDRIDWILVGGPLRVLSAETVLHSAEGRYPSDHFPVVARLEIQE